MTLTNPLYLLIDPASGGFSASRTGLLIMHIVGTIAIFWMLWMNQWTQAAAVVTSITASDATVYFSSTRKQPTEKGE
jgi:hypothetical protein